MSPSIVQVADPGYTPSPSYAGRIATINVGQSFSTCSLCGRGCLPADRRHTWSYGYGPQGPGCGATFAVRDVKRVYVASSWRNPFHGVVIGTLRAAEIEHYNFREPGAGRNGFAWSEVIPAFDINDQEADVEGYLAALDHPRAVEGYTADFEAMQNCDTFVMVLPCGKSAHLELGWAAGVGRRTAILLDSSDPLVQPELMYKMADMVTNSVMDLLAWLGVKD